ncbi:hypothetical protein Ahy_A08g038353 [Arachis hypogaea]|uniref:Uncharacterized protein n=1 Tax=Arachis hypogaea TaxID=3818 RepID=A0A445BTK0_ARAHY|nr:hypothetical protein Ahy_A08g038353 [Arachis hypogaea]
MLFSFKDKKSGLQIIQNGPWNVRKNLVNLRLWMEGESVFEIDHDFMEFWIQVHGIPLDHMNKETRIFIGGMLGVLVEAEDPKVDGIFRRSFLRIKVSINITKTLPTELGVSQVYPVSAIGGVGSKQHEWTEEDVKQACDQQNLGRESGEEQSTGESRIRAEQNLQQKIRKESV